MNAMVNLLNGFKLAEGFCEIHQVQKCKRDRIKFAHTVQLIMFTIQSKATNHVLIRWYVTSILAVQCFLNAMLNLHFQIIKHVHKHKQIRLPNASSMQKHYLQVINQISLWLVQLARVKRILVVLLHQHFSKSMYVRYITSEELAQRVMNAWDKDTKDQSEASVIYEFTTYDLLILDEYGLHDRGTRLEIIHKILTARYDRKTNDAHFKFFYE